MRSIAAVLTFLLLSPSLASSAESGRSQHDIAHFRVPRSKCSKRLATVIERDLRFRKEILQDENAKAKIEHLQGRISRNWYLAVLSAGTPRPHKRFRMLTIKIWRDMRIGEIGYLRNFFRAGVSRSQIHFRIAQVVDDRNLLIESAESETTNAFGDRFPRRFALLTGVDTSGAKEGKIVKVNEIYEVIVGTRKFNDDTGKTHLISKLTPFGIQQPKIDRPREGGIVHGVFEVEGAGRFDYLWNTNTPYRYSEEITDQ